MLPIFMRYPSEHEGIASVPLFGKGGEWEPLLWLQVSFCQCFFHTSVGKLLKHIPFLAEYVGVEFIEIALRSDFFQ